MRVFCACRRMEAWTTAREYPRCRPCPSCGTVLVPPLASRERPSAHQWARDASGALRCRACEKTPAELEAFQPTV